MDPFKLVQDFFDNLARTIVILGLIVAAIVGACYYLTRDPSPAERMQKANPGWTVTKTDNQPALADDGSGRGVVMLHGDDLGSHQIERIDCAEVRAAFPKWFFLPDAPIGNCLRIHGATPPTLLLNMQTPVRMAVLWERQYKPVLDRLKLGHSGGGWGPSIEEIEGPDGKRLTPESGSRSYGIDPPPGSGERVVSINAWSSGGRTRLVFTFRQPPPT